MLFSTEDEQTVENTTTETTIFSMTVVGGTLGAHNAVRVRLALSPDATADEVTLTLRVKFGGSTIATFVTSFWSGGSWDTILEVLLRGNGDTSHQCGYLTLSGGGLCGTIRPWGGRGGSGRAPYWLGKSPLRDAGGEEGQR